MRKFYGFAVLLMALTGSSALAAGGMGQIFFGANAGIVTTDQEDMNELKSRANARDTVSASDLKNAWELGFELGYRFAGSMFAVSLRPSYFTQSTDGSGTSGSYKYSVSGFSVFPMFRIYPLESDLMRFYMQMGLGYGMATGKIREASASADFSGTGYGSMVGLGAEFLISDTHSLGVEGNMRYLSFERNTVDSRAGTFATDSLSQSGADQEVELDGRDFKTTMTGIVIMARYVFYY